MTLGLQIIGEASRTLSVNLKDQHPEGSWSKTIGVRNILVHDYFGVDEETIRSILN
jgi:uncharacterized protein with HEPN domain